MNTNPEIGTIVAYDIIKELIICFIICFRSELDKDISCAFVIKKKRVNF